MHAAANGVTPACCAQQAAGAATRLPACAGGKRMGKTGTVPADREEPDGHLSGGWLVMLPERKLPEPQERRESLSSACARANGGRAAFCSILHRACLFLKSPVYAFLHRRGGLFAAERVCRLALSAKCLQSDSCSVA